MNTFTGSYSEFGTYLAQKLIERNHSFNTHVNWRTLNKQLKIYQKFWPELIEESKAVAKIVNLPEDEILYDEIAGTIDNQRSHVVAAHDAVSEACTIFAIHENGKTFVGRNYDWDPSARDYFQVYQINLIGKNRYFAFSDEGTYPHIIRYIAETCKTTKEALGVFRKIPVAVPKNFLIADRTGDIAVVEHAAKDYKVIRPKSILGADYLVHTNHCLDPGYTKVDPVLRTNPSANTFLRYAEADWMVRKELPNYQFTDLWRVLRSSHYVYNENTIWSLALELSEPRYNFYRDTAQGQKQIKFNF